MDKNGDGYVTTRDIESLSLQDLQAISKEVRILPSCVYLLAITMRQSHNLVALFFLKLEPYEPSNHYTFEYSFITFDYLWKLINKVKKEIKVLSPARWERIYTAEGGSKHAANEVLYEMFRNTTRDGT